MKYQIADESDVQKLAMDWHAPELPAADPDSPRRITSISEIPSIRTFATQKIEFLVEGLIAVGTVTAITGESGCGKSTLATALASAVERGVPFAGLPTRRCPVLMLDRENPVSVIAERFDRLGIDDSPNFIVWGGWCLEEATDPTSPLVVGWVESLEPKPLIIVDSFVAFNSGDENDATQTRSYMQGFRRLADLGATVIVIHHGGKSESNKDYRGSSDIKASIDVGLHLANLGDPSRLSSMRLRSFKSRFTVQRELILHYTSSGFQIDLRPLSKSNEELLTDLLVANPGVTASEFEELASRIEVSRGRARDFLATGKQSGRIRVDKGSHNKQNHIWVGSK
jgi:archaellum biogenesis ATPase FlaH